MFGEKSSAAIYLERNKIIFAHPKKQILEELPLDSGLINHLEIVDEEKFVQVLKSFFEKMPNDPAVIFLSKPIIFEREIEDGVKEEPEVMSPIEGFLAMVPIDKAKLGSILLKGDHSTLCLAANKEYYELTIKSAELAGIKVIAVVPAFLFDGLEGKDGIFAEAVDRAIADKNTLKNANFLDDQGLSYQASDDDLPTSADLKRGDAPAHSGTKTIVLLLLLVGLLSFSVIFSYMNGLFDRFIPGRNSISGVSQEPAVSAPVSPTLDNTATIEEASDSAIKMGDLRAKITNGTGVSGQAARAQDALARLNMRETQLNIEASKGAVVTEIGYDPRVPKNLVDEVRVVLEEVFIEVEEKEASDTGEFDFLILTGKEK